MATEIRSIDFFGASIDCNSWVVSLSSSAKSASQFEIVPCFNVFPHGLSVYVLCVCNIQISFDTCGFIQKCVFDLCNWIYGVSFSSCVSVR